MENVEEVVLEVENKKETKPKWYETAIGIFQIKDFALLVLGVLIALFTLLPQFKHVENDVLLSANDTFFNGYQGSTLIFVFYFIPILGGVSYLFANKHKVARVVAFVLDLASAVILLSSAQIVGQLSEVTLRLSWGPIFAGGFAVLGVLTILRENFQENALTVQEIVEIGLLVALALVFDQLVPGIRVSGGAGSINLAMLPLFLIAFRFNLTKSWLAIGVVFGLISCLIDGYGLATFPFDYFLGYGSISFASLFRKHCFPLDGEKIKWYQFALFALAIIVGTVGRYGGATISSIVLYGYSFVPALVFNATYVFGSGGAALIVLLLLYKPIVMINNRFKH